MTNSFAWGLRPNFKLLARNVLAVACLTLAASTNVSAQSFMSSRPSSENGKPVTKELPTSVPVGSVVLWGSSPAFQKETRARTCDEVYGVPPAEVSYSGGPIIESRLQTAPGVLTDWARESGQCLRNHEYFRDTTACPSNQTGTITERRRYKVTDSDEIIEDTGWVETARTCAFYMLESLLETRTQECAANQTGLITEQRSYEAWSDGTSRNHGNWYTVSNTCSFFLVSTATEYENASCPANMQGSITRQRTYEMWSDGSPRNYSAWVESANSCSYYYLSTEYENISEGCGDGWTGWVNKQRSYQRWSDGSHRGHSDWWETGRYCRPNEVTLWTPHVHFSPPRSGKSLPSTDSPRNQVYGPHWVSDKGVSLTLRLDVHADGRAGTFQYCSGGGGDAGEGSCGSKFSRAANLEIWVNSPSRVRVYWDRDYSYFWEQDTDSNGYVAWWNVPNSEWTDNETQFGITVWPR